MRGGRLIGLIGCLTVGVVVLGVALAGGWWLRRPVVAMRVLEELPRPAVAGAEPLNRIVVQDQAGNILTVAPDGSAVERLTDDASRDHSYRYPTWSPDARHIALVEFLQGNDDSVTTNLLVLSAGGGATQRVATEYPPFYLYWNPTGKSLAFLSNWADSMALRLVDVAGGATEATTVSEGMPFFFSWAPKGEAMLAHIGDTLLTFLDASGKQQPLDIAAGSFQAPHWSTDGRRLAFVSEGEDEESVLSISDAQGGAITELAHQPGFVSLNWSPDNQHLAYSYSEESVGLAAFGPLWVRDTASEQVWELSEEPVIAFFWSPDGRRVAFLRPEHHAPIDRAPVAAPLRQEGEFWLRWHVWDGEQVYPLALFSPSETFLLDYLRFFDQYAQSSSLWSLDSQTLVYAGLSESGLDGIWTLPIEEGSTPRRIASGSFAAWSPR